MSNRDSYRLEDAEVCQFAIFKVVVILSILLLHKVILTEVNDIQHALQASEVKKAKLMMVGMFYGYSAL